MMLSRVDMGDYASIATTLCACIMIWQPFYVTVTTSCILYHYTYKVYIVHVQIVATEALKRRHMILITRR